MASFSVMQAFGAGFRMIRRAPLAPLAWGVVLAVSFLADTPEDQPLWIEVVLYGVGTVLFTPLAAATLRAELRPDDRRFLYLRLGMDEVRLLPIVLVQSLILYGLMEAIGWVIDTARMGGETLNLGTLTVRVGSAAILFLLLPILAAFWLPLRLSMAGQAILSKKEFSLPWAWSLTQGHGWKLAVLAILVTGLTAALIVVTLAIAGGLLGFQNLTALMDGERRPGDWPLVIAGFAALSVSGGYIWPLLAAPFADAYRQIAEPHGNLADIF